MREGELPVRRRRRFEQSRSPIRRQFASNGEPKSSRTPGATLRTLLCRELASPSDANSRRNAAVLDRAASLVICNQLATNRFHDAAPQPPGL